MKVNFSYWIGEACGVCIEAIRQDDILHIIDCDNGYIGACYSFSGFEHLINSFYGGNDFFCNLLLNDTNNCEEKLMDAASQWFEESYVDSNNVFKLFE